MRETVTAGKLERTANEHHVTVNTITDPPLYSGRATIEYDSLAVQERTPGDRATAVQTPILKVPVAATLLPTGTHVIVDASLSDASLIGRTFSVTGSPDSAQVTCHRYPLKEFT